MQTLNNETVLTTWESFFDQATEDTSIYLWAAQSWPAPPSDYTQGYVLTLALSHRARSCAAQGWIKDNVSQDTAGYAVSLNRMFGQAEAAMDKSLAESGEDMQAVLNTQVLSMALTLDKTLDKVLRLEEDTRLYEGLENLALELKEAGHEFIVRFAMLEHLGRELSTPLFEGLECPDLRAAISRIEIRFQQHRQCFRALQNLWPAFAAREYGAALPWLEQAPAASALENESMEVPLMAAFSSILYSESQDLDDYKMQQAIAMGLEELNPVKENSLHQNLALNAKAMDLAHDVRLSAREAMNESHPPAVLPALAKALKKPGPAAGWLADAYREISRLFSPKLVAAAAMACLAVAVFITFPAGEDSRRIASPATELASASFQPALPLGSLSIEARKNESQLNSVSAMGASAPNIFTMEPGWNLESGDALRVNACVDQDAYVHVIHVGPGKKASGLFSGPLKAGEVLELPPKGDWFVLDRKVGEESIILVSGHTPVENFESAIARITSAGNAAQVFSGRHVQVFSFKHL